MVQKRLFCYEVDDLASPSLAVLLSFFLLIVGSGLKDSAALLSAAEVFFVDAFVDAACALSEGAEEVLALDDEAAEEDVDGLDWELSFVEVEEVPEEAFEGLLDEGLSSDAGGGGGDDVAGERPSTSSAYCCKISRCRLVSERGMLTSNCTIKSPF